LKPSLTPAVGRFRKEGFLAFVDTPDPSRVQKRRIGKLAKRHVHPSKGGNPKD